MKRATLLIAAVLTVLPVLLTLYYVQRYEPPFIWGDEWLNRLPVALRAVEGTLSPADLFEPFGGMHHRVVFAQLSAALSAVLFGWDMGFETIITLLVAGACLAAVYVLARRALSGAGQPAMLIVLVAAVWLIFSVQGQVIWTAAVFGLRFHAVLFFLLGLLALTSERLTGTRAGLAIACATLATFSVSIGLVAWPAYVLTVLLRRDREWRYLAALALAGGAVWILYSFGLPISNAVSAFDVRTFLLIIPVLLGAPFIPDNAIASAVIGLSGVMLFAANLGYLIFRGRRDALLIPVALGVFALLSEALTAFGRSYDGIFLGLRPWYVPQTAFFWIALAMISVSAFQAALQRPESPSRRLVTLPNAALGTVFTLTYLLAIPTAFELSKILESMLSDIERCVRIYPFTDENPCAREIHGTDMADTHAVMGRIIRHNLLAYRFDDFYDIPDVYVPGSPLLIEAADARQAELIAYAVLPGLPMERKLAGAGGVPALLAAAVETGQFWTLHAEGMPVPDPLAAAGRDYEIVYQASIGEGVPYILTGYQIR